MIPEIRIGQSDVRAGRVKAREMLDTSYLRLYDRLPASGEEGMRMLDIIEESFSLAEAVGAKVPAGLDNLKSNSVAFWVSGQYCIEKIDFEGNGSGVFRESTVDTSGNRKAVAASFLSHYSKGLELDENVPRLTRDFFEWTQEQAKPEIADSFLRENPVLVLGERYDSSLPEGWDEIVGYENVKGYFQDLSLVLSRLEEVYSWVGGCPLPKGIMLSGPPGTGKSSVAEIFCRSLGIPFEEFSALEIGSKYQFEPMTRLQEKFDAARSRLGSFPASVIFIDEIDAIASSRSSLSEDRNSLVTCLNVNMDGYKSVDGLIVIGATNRESSIDASVRSRFPVRFEMGLPDYQTREGIYKKLLGRHSDMLGGVDYGLLSEASEGLSGRDISSVVDYAVWESVVSRLRSGSYPSVDTDRMLGYIRGEEWPVQR